MSSHAKLAPSSAHRWIPCPGSIAFCSGYPNEDTEATIEGTKAHAMAADVLNGKVDFVPGAEMDSYVKVYTDDIKRRAEGKILLIEQRVYIEPWTSEPNGFGTSDAILFDPATGHLEVRDLKYGMVLVYAEDNEQLQLYALGAKHLVETFGYEVKSVTVAIHQPRRDHYDEWNVTLEKLEEFGAYARSRGMMALSCMPGEELHPDPHGCEYCPAKNDCPAYMKRVHELVYEQFEEKDGKPHGVARPVEGEITPGELDMIEAWCAAKRKWIFEQLQAGAPMKSWKLVQGRGGNRTFVDLRAVEGLLRTMRFKVAQFKQTSMLPLTQIEKLVGKDKWPEFAKYVRQTPGQAQMAPMSDKRPAYSAMADSEFEEII